jgi:hypothetical protein
VAYLKAVGERKAKVESRAVVASEKKEAMELRRVTCMLSAKVDLEQELARARGQLAQHPEASAAVAVTVQSTDEEETLRAGALKAIISSTLPSYTLPLEEETPDIMLEKRQAAESFVNRVVAARKLNDRRLSRLLINSQHPLEQSRTLSDLLGQLTLNVDAEACNAAAQLVDDRARQTEDVKAQYHTLLMQHATAGRVALKVQRHRERLAAQVREARAEEERRLAAAERLKVQQAEDQRQGELFRERKRRVEAAAHKRAQEEAEYDMYVSRQRNILHPEGSQ